VAILVRQLIPDLADWRLTILATDINLRFLRRAEEAIYTSWPFRDCPAGIREQYFESDARGRLKLLPDIRKMVTFAYLNLAEGVYPSLTNNTAGMDLILCRNVLMYFTPEQAQRTVQRFRRCLVGGGWLLVSPCETSHQLFSGFATVSFPGAILYRKEAKRSGPAVTAPDASVEYLEASSWLANDSMAAPEPASLAIEEHTAPVAAADAELAAKPALLPYHEVCGLYDRGSYSEARQALQTWLEVNPTDAEAMALLARACANQGRLEEARAWCEKAINADRLRAAFHYLRAMILQEQADEDHAAEALRHALYLDPDFVLAHVALGNLRRRQGKPGESRKHFQIALGLLRSRPVEEPVPESEGMTSGRMMEIIQAAV
jgi:chemotaxis protein methyltransferase CheR